MCHEWGWNSLNNNRNNRRRGRSNRNNQSSGNQLNRIDSRARGNAPQLLDKYKKLAQDAQHNGDRVQAEYYLQFADHYFRVIADNKARQDEARAKRNDDRVQSNDDDDDDDNDEGRRDNRRTNQRRPRSRGDDGDNASVDEGERGNEGEADDGQDEAAPKPRRRARKPQNDESDGDSNETRPPVRKKATRGESRRKPRGNGDASSARDDSTGEIDSAVLPPAIGSDSPASRGDGDDSLEAVG